MIAARAGWSEPRQRRYRCNEIEISVLDDSHFFNSCHSFEGRTPEESETS